MRGGLLICAVACAAGLCTGCSTSPVTGRQQLNVLVEPIHTAYSDFKLAFLATPRERGPLCATQGDCTEPPAVSRLEEAIQRIAARLAPAATQLSPELAERIPRIEVFVADKDAPGASSSPGGKIAVHSGIAALDLGEEELAFALAREIGRLAHAHHREAASAGVTASLATNLALANTTVASLVLLDFLVPWSALMKFAAAFGSSLTAQTAVERSQQEEADEFACRLLVAAAYDPARLRRELPEDALDTGWPTAFSASLHWAAVYRERQASAATQSMPPDPEAPSPL